MAVKIRFQRWGRKNHPIYKIVVADARAPRDGRFIEKLGTYNPHTDPGTVSLKVERATSWIMKGAQPTPVVHDIFSKVGINGVHHILRGVIKGALSLDDAKKRFVVLMKEKNDSRRRKVNLVHEISAETFWDSVVQQVALIKKGNERRRGVKKLLTEFLISSP